MKSSLIWLLLYYGFARHLPDSYRFPPFGTLARNIRAFVCKRIFKRMGRNVNVERGAHFGRGADVEIGDDSGIGTNCQVPGTIRIGAYVMMGPDVLILEKNHQYERVDIPMMFQGEKDAPPVIIRDDVWIGARCIILPGVVINEGAIIGAGSVVTKSVPAFAVCAGNPARVIKFRDRSTESQGGGIDT